MNIVKDKLKALAEAFPADLDFDSNTLPFFSGPSGESLGGGATGFFSVYGQPFEIDGDTYDGNEYVSICTREFAEFMCAARSGVLELLAEIDQLKAESEALRKALGKISVQVDGNIRCTVRDVVNGLPDVQDIYDYCDNIDEIIAAAMAKESSRG